jgi:hypothetical protein
MLTQKSNINVSEAIEQYQNGSYGLAWDVFWDYKCETEADGDSIFSERHILTTSLHLFSYLACFGMARGSTHLTDITVCDLAEKLRKLRDSYNDVKHIKFEMLAESDRDLVVLFFEDTAKALEEPIRVSSSITMITKIHLAAWGQTPAYDKFFKLGYSRLIDMAFWWNGKSSEGASS